METKSNAALNGSEFRDGNDKAFFLSQKSVGKTNCSLGDDDSLIAFSLCADSDHLFIRTHTQG